MFIEKFKQMEIEKKKTRPTKRNYVGPIIRYHSLSMPLIEEVPTSTSIRKKKSRTDDSDLHNISGIFKMEDDDNE